jgi:predicted RNA binding protein YcfA (HicA-like mRNA interferase family)
LTPTHWRVQVRIFEADGSVCSRHEGDHRIYVKPGVPRPVVIPEYTEVRLDIITRNMRTAGMTRQRYFELLAEVG